MAKSDVSKRRQRLSTIVHLQGPPYLSGHYISSPRAISDCFRQKSWKNAILVRFKGLFCHIVHCCDLLGSGIILENVEIIFFKIHTNDKVYVQGPNSYLELGIQMTGFLVQILFSGGFEY